ncbi:MAG: cation diffusion facilitator family transporter [Candidatus Krumholzibacteriia bacterium]
MTHPQGTPSASSRKRLALVLGMTCIVMIVEVLGSLWSGSLVLLADAGHMLSDVGALGLALFAIWFAARPSPPHRTFGYYRAEILAAVANAVLLALVTFFVIRESIARLREPPEFQAFPVLLIGCLGFVVNLVGVRLLHAGARGSLNVRAAYLEVLADMLGSLGVIVAAALTMGLGWWRADPLASLAIAVFIIPRIWLLMRDATDVLMEAAPRGMDIADVRRVILGQEGVVDVHDLHVWTITSGRVCLSAHVVTHEGTDRDRVILGVNRLLRASFGLDHTTLQVEGEDEPMFSGRGSGRGCDACPPGDAATTSPTPPRRAPRT